MTAWIQADWPAPPGVVAGTTTRSGGVSSAAFASMNLGAHVGDDAAAVAENRRTTMRLLDLPAEPQWLRQVHGTSVAVDKADKDCDYDAMVTGLRDNVCVVMTADCLPVVLSSADGNRVGVAHAGWRGLVDGVIEAAVAALHAGDNVQAWLGPAISQDAFEVGPEVYDAFVAADEAAAECFEVNERRHYQADLYGLARQRLAKVGVHAVYGGQYCTYGDPQRFFSYRRDGRCGRMATLIFSRGTA